MVLGGLLDTCTMVWACQRLRPLYESVAKEIQKNDKLKVGVAKVDATVTSITFFL